MYLKHNKWESIVPAPLHRHKKTQMRKRGRTDEASAATQSVRVLGASLKRPSRIVPLAGAAFAEERTDLDVWSLTEARSVAVPVRSIILHNVLCNLAGRPARESELTEDQGDLEALQNADTDGFLTRAADEHGRVFDVFPEQLALAVAIEAGVTRTTFHERGGRAWYAPKRQPVASFSLLSSAPGSGKTSVVILAALHAVGHGWEEARRTFQQWRSLPINNDPEAPVKRAGDSTTLARAAIIVVTESTFGQWEGALKNTVRLLDDGPVISTDPLRFMQKKPQTAMIAVVNANVMTEYFNTGWKVGCVFLAMDEISVQGSNLPTGKKPGEKPFPSIFRTVGMSATLVKLFEQNPGSIGSNRTNRFFSQGAGNFLKTLLLPQPERHAVPKGKKERTSMWRRVALATVTPSVQIALSTVVAARMRPRVVVHNVRITAKTVYDVIGEPIKTTAAVRLKLGHIIPPSEWATQDEDEHMPTGLEDSAAVVKERYGEWNSGDLIAPRVASRVILLERMRVSIQRFYRFFNTAPLDAIIIDTANDISVHRRDRGLPPHIRALDQELTGRGRPVACSRCCKTARLTDTFACGACCAILCAHCAEETAGEQGCDYCKTEEAPKDVYADAAAGKLGLTGATHWAMKSAFSEGVQRVLMFGPTKAPPDPVKTACDAVGAELVSDAVEFPAGKVLLYLGDDEHFQDTLTGINLGGADAVIVLNRLSDEQQAFSRALRMTAHGPPPTSDLNIYRILHSMEPPGSLGGTPTTFALAPRHSEEDVGFPAAALAACRTSDDQLLSGEEVDSPYGVLPKEVSITLVPTAERRVDEYRLNVTVDSIAGGGDTFELLFRGSANDPFVPPDAAGLRLYTQDDRVLACWVGSTRQPVQNHPELPASRISVKLTMGDGSVLSSTAAVAA